MNILMITNEFPPSVGGVQTHVYELSKALVKLGHSVRVVTRTGGRSPLLRESMNGITVERMKLPDSHLLYDWILRRHLRQSIREHAIDIIHVHGMRPLNACRDLPIPVVFTNHTSSFVRRAKQGGKSLKKMEKQLRSASTVLAVSDILVEKTRMTGYAGPVQFISNGVDTEVFYPGSSPVRSRLSIPEDAFVIAVACRLEPVKGIRFLAQAVAEVEDPNLHLVIAGSGSEEKVIRTILEKKIRSGHAHLLGSVDYHDMPDIYRSANASALPSLMEATSIAGLEAMACGLPLVASRVGGIPFIVEDGETGFLTEPENPEGLRRSILQLLADRHLAEKMGEASLARVHEQFTWNNIAQQVCDTYQKLTSPDQPESA